MFFTKNEENLHAKHLQGGPRQLPRSPLLKHTTSDMELIQTLKLQPIWSPTKEYAQCKFPMTNNLNKIIL